MVDLEDMAARALVPEQLPHYVQSVSALRPLQAGPCLGWRLADRLVLAAYPDREPPYTPAELADAEQAVADAARLPGLRRITVLAPFRPAAAPPHAVTVRDACWAVPLPLPAPAGKLRNMLRRARREIVVTADRRWTDEHARLRDDAVRRFCEAPGERALSPEAASIFDRIEDYLAAGPQTLLYSARRLDNGRLCACAVGDHTAYATAFYMFAFRAPSAPPGTADALVAALLAEAERRGQRRCNLGLGVHDGIRFFKQKWRARPWLPFLETSWTIANGSGGRLSRLFRRILQPATPCRP